MQSRLARGHRDPDRHRVTTSQFKAAQRVRVVALVRWSLAMFVVMVMLHGRAGIRPRSCPESAGPGPRRRARQADRPGELCYGVICCGSRDR